MAIYLILFQPCGDEFIITKEELMQGLEEATCPSCSLVVKVIYNKVNILNITMKILRKKTSLY